MPVSAARLRFFLGGHDLEMLTIRDLVRECLGPGAVLDKGLAWGARAADYAAEIAAWRAGGRVAVLVELLADAAHAAAPDLILIDHHGERVAEPAALRQVFTLLRLPESAWTRHFALVAANDVGHVAAMRAMGATVEEMAAIRAADRRAQGINAFDEAAGLTALENARRAFDGRLLVVDLPHGRTATVTDPLALRGDGVEEQLLILCPGAVHAFAQGAAVAALDAAFPGGWRGGELPRRGFWGLGRAVPEAALLAALESVMVGAAAATKR